jgi:hypothetical protein
MKKKQKIKAKKCFHARGLGWPAFLPTQRTSLLGWLKVMKTTPNYSYNLVFFRKQKNLQGIFFANCLLPIATRSSTLQYDPLQLEYGSLNLNNHFR